MFDLSFAELALIVVVAVVFIGPKELPVVLRALSKGMRAIRSLAHEIRLAFDDLSRESGVKEAADDISNEIKMIKGDDGNFYESYTVPVSKITKPAPVEETHAN